MEREVGAVMTRAEREEVVGVMARAAPMEIKTAKHQAGIGAHRCWQRHA